MANAGIDQSGTRTLLAISNADGKSLVPIYADPITHRLLVDSSGGGGGGTVTTVSVVTANGLSGTVANPTTTPAITLNVAALDATKIANGNVSNTEFQYLDGVTSSIQTQLDAKSAVSSGSGAPVSTPGAIGQLYIDTTNKNAYISVATSSSADWNLIASFT